MVGDVQAGNGLGDTAETEPERHSGRPFQSHTMRDVYSPISASPTIGSRSGQKTARWNRIAFLDQAIEELSEDGKIIPVRLSVFVEMVKAQPWDLSTLANLGGVRGIGTQFLEEAFSSPHSPASHRIHEPAVRNVLRLLLPDQGGNLKGTMKTEAELRVASGYENQSPKFDELMEILDTQLRLITPTDPIGSAVSDDISFSESDDGIRYFQLTHDFSGPRAV